MPVLSRPMDFTTMRCHLKEEQYTSLQDLELDFNLVVTNCMTYNMQETSYYRRVDLSDVKLDLFQSSDWICLGFISRSVFDSVCCRAGRRMKNLGGQVFTKAKEGVLGRVGEEGEKEGRKPTKVKPKKLSRTNSKDKLGADNLVKTEALVKAPKTASKVSERMEGTKMVGEASDSGVASDNSATSSEFAVPNSLPR